MATLVFFHAHPDDESIATGGAMTRAAAEGHRVVLVVGTGGEEGEVADGFLDEGEALEQRRRVETDASALILGVARVVWLGYRDSGMMGTPANDHVESFWQADVEEAARALAAVLTEEEAEALVVYDENGGYGHPDHIQVHRVGHRAAELAGTGRVFEATMNRDQMVEMMRQAQEAGIEGFEDDEDPETFGVPDAEITTAVDVTAWLAEKEASMRAHASQIAEDSWFLTLPEGVFEIVFGTEWFVRTTPPFTGTVPADRESWLLDD
jgi:LmbE family N-acetylglucosaminyl deacetylase